MARRALPPPAPSRICSAARASLAQAPRSDREIAQTGARCAARGRCVALAALAAAPGARPVAAAGAQLHLLRMRACLRALTARALPPPLRHNACAHQ